jgi:hypothetical protein
MRKQGGSIQWFVSAQSGLPAVAWQHTTTTVPAHYDGSWLAQTYTGTTHHCKQGTQEACARS